MTRPQVLFSGLINYLNAPATARARAAQNARGGDYRLYTDYYVNLRHAVRRDRDTTRDGAALRARAMNTTDPRKQARFADLASKWEDICPRWDLYTPLAPPSREVVTVGGLNVAIGAHFAEQSPTGKTEVVLVRYADAPISSTVIDAVLRLMQRAYPGTTAVFVDLARGTVTTSAERKRLDRYDSWLESEAAGLAHLLDMAA